ncbi:MAG: phage major capsid protein [Pseudomonadota bacterium]
MSLETKAPETKALDDVQDVRRAVGEFLNAFELFKEENDRRLDDIETRGAADPLSDDKLDRINRALDAQQSRLDRLALEKSRPSLGAEDGARERKQAVRAYMRAGDAAGLVALEEKALSIATDAEGGYLAPLETERMINEAVRDISPIRQTATVRQIGSASFRKPVSAAGAEAGWVGDKDPRTETDTPDLRVVDLPTAELYAMPAATPTLLEDAVVDVEQWLADEVRAEFAAQEGAAFVAGTGTNQPRGFLNYTAVAEGSQVWGQIGYIATGVSGAFAASNPADDIIDLIYTPKATYRGNGRFVMSKSTVGAVRKLKDGDNNYLWRPSADPGVGATLMGYPITEAEEVPAIGPDAPAIAFGDFARGYLIVDRVGLRILRDPYSAKPYVLFYTTKRVGGGVQDFEAIKLLKFGTS